MNFDQIGDLVFAKTADLPGRSVAITSTCTTILESFDEYGKRGKSKSKNEFLEVVCQFLHEIIIYQQNWSVEFIEKLRYGLR